MNFTFDIKLKIIVSVEKAKRVPLIWFLNDFLKYGLYKADFGLI